MELLTPLGLVALVGIPIIIIIYILKPKYQEKTITSTYIWKLSLKYRKKKLPLQWLKRSLLLIVQLLVVTALSFMIAQPYVPHPKAQYEKIIILDASASMLAVDEAGKTRFDKAKEYILSEAEQSSQEYDLSIILCDSTPEWLVRNAFGSGEEGDAEGQKALGVNKINIELGKTDCTFGTADYGAAIALADEYRATHPDSKILLYTDHDFKQEGRVAVKNFAAEGDFNAAIVFAEETAGGYDTINFDVQVGSFGARGDYTLVVDVKGINGFDESSPKSSLHKEISLSLAKDETVIERVRGERDEVMPDGSVEDMRIYSYDYAEFRLVTAGGEAVKDNFPYDDEYYCYGLTATNFKARVQTDDESRKSYLVSALSAVGNVDCTEFSPRMRDLAINAGGQYNDAVLPGYDLYVFEGKMPYSLPDDGAVWLVNVPSGWSGAAALGISVGDQVVLSGGENINFAVTAEQSPLVNGLESLGNQMKVWRYRPLAIAEDSPFAFRTVLTVSGEPVMIVGENAAGVRVVVLSVDLSFTDLPLMALPVMTANVCDYTLSYPVDPLAVLSGARVNVYSKPLVTNVNVYTGDGQSPVTSFDKSSGEFPASFVADRPTTYFVEQEFSNTDEKLVTRLYAHLAGEECDIVAVGGMLSEKDGTETGDALTDINAKEIQDITFWFALGLIALLFVEWGLQSREQY